MYAGLFDGAESATLALDPSRYAYLHLVRGTLSVNGLALQSGDAARLQGEPALHLGDAQGAEVIVFDLSPRAA
jgi:redox-sensitive bicupin YhaK (pirin superfamily)